MIHSPSANRSEVTLLPEPKKSISKLSPVKWEDSEGGRFPFEESVVDLVGLVFVVPFDSEGSSSTLNNPSANESYEPVGIVS